LEETLKNSKSTLARMHALCVLDGLELLDETTERKALNDPDGAVRQQAVRLAVKIFYRQGSHSKPWRELIRLADDSDILVRYQLAFALGDFHHLDAINALEKIIRRDSGDRWMRAAVLSSLANGAGEMFRQLAGAASGRDSPGGQEFLVQLVGMIRAKNEAAEVNAVVTFLEKSADSSVAFPLTRALGDGLRNAGSSLTRVGSTGRLKPVVVRAKTTAKDPKIPERTRVQAIQLLALSSFAEA